ncbi:diguanylate cyclase [Curvibacter sp. RS43]|uniref:sensor domain-containing diguanylate cyclase n=1 Tax=Curvibacter microcysteis TaxID=3026419 RepID=UPI002363093B|nr:sensor domain-containing diguanylate cyclase [Curvibacter sp. RS43]MDD0810801.1 diguanylate cyclase [Curvibacter sp. RS43]
MALQTHPAVASMREVHWVVRMNYRGRTVSWGMIFAVCVLLGQERAWSWGHWVALVLQFVAYPQLSYLLARHSAEPVRSELRILTLDSFCFGLWMSWMGAPLWLAYALCACGAMTLAAFRGMGGLYQAVLAQASGALCGVLLWGFEFRPDMGPASTALSMASLTTYLWIFAHAVNVRTHRLNRIRWQLKDSERALQQQLLEISALQSQLREQANRDALTGLFNRRFLDATMDRELARCQRMAEPLSLILIDIDHFKNINDTFGHAAGDEVLRRLAFLLSTDARSSDVVCRHGGEEFLLMLPHMPLAVAMARAEHYRSMLESSVMLIEGKRMRCTLSAGVACYPVHGKGPSELMAAADSALYRAKRTGRNRIERAAEDLSTKSVPA